MTNSHRQRQSSTPCILVVNDEASTRTTFRRTLEEVGYFVDEAADGREALRAIDRNFYEVIVLDLAMPEIDGIEFLQTAGRTLPQVRIAVTSGFMQGAMLAIAEHLGADAALLKPVAPEQLLKAVCDMLTAYYEGRPSAAARKAAGDRSGHSSK